MYDRNNYGPTSQAQMNADPAAWAAYNEPKNAAWAAPMNVMSPQMIDQWDAFRQRGNAQTAALNSGFGVGVPGATGPMTPEGYDEKFKVLQAIMGKYGGLGGLGGLLDSINKPLADKKTQEEQAQEQYYADQMDPNTPAYR